MTTDSPLRPAPRYRFWLHALAMLLVLGTFLLVGVGGSVTSHAAGMAVPDWPGTFGYNMFLAPLEVWFRDPETGQFFQGRFWEHSHRLIGSAVGFLTIGLAVALWVTQRGRPWLRWLGFTLLGAVIIQGLMGGFRVTENSELLAGIHGVFGQIVLATTVLTAAAVGGVWLSATAEAGEGAAPGDHRTTLLRWEIIALPALVLAGLVGSMVLAGGDDDLIVWSVSDVGMLWIVCMGAYAAICLWRLAQHVRSAMRDRRHADPHPTSPIAARTCLVLLGLLLVQLMLGAAVRHAGAERAITDAPLAFGHLLPPTSMQDLELAIATLPADVSLPPPSTTLADVWLHWTHRAWAIIVAAAVVGVVISIWRNRQRLHLPLVLPPLMLVLAVTFLQIMLGVMTVWSEIHPTMATYHQATGAALLGLTTWLAIRVHLASHPRAAASAESAAAQEPVRYNPVPAETDSP